MTTIRPITVLGAGSWGTALAFHLANTGQIVRLWGRDVDQIERMRQTHINERYLPGIVLPDSLHLFHDLTQALETVSDILLVVPSIAFRSFLERLRPLLREDMRIAWATKGIDRVSNQLFDQVITDMLGRHALAVLSGPSFAREVAVGLPTAISVASNDVSFAHDLVDRLNCRTFRVYISDDLTGVQLGGAVKNVIAIAVGFSDGLRYGANARSALITRGLAEMMRLGIKMGAKQSTFIGLSGVGDLILTCTDDQSRNRRLGLMLGQGLNVEDAMRNIGQVVEGVHTASQVMALAKRYQVDIPIGENVYRILQGEITPDQVVNELMSREPKEEI